MLEPLRKYLYYHNKSHVTNLLIQCNGSEPLASAIRFHDANYDPRRSNEDNIEEAKRYAREYTDNMQVQALIEFTKYDRKPENELEQWFFEHDFLEPIMNPDNLLPLFKEYQFAGLKAFKEGRIKFLEEAERIFDIDCGNAIAEVKIFQPSQAIYAGSFNPFHIGHLDVLRKAEKIFDVVIVAQGKSLQKSGEKDFHSSVKIALPYHRIIEIESSLLWTMKTENVTHLIRGARNSFDYQHEQDFINTLKSFDSEIEMVIIPTAQELSHVSSSTIRELWSAGCIRDDLVPDYRVVYGVRDA